MAMKNTKETILLEAFKLFATRTYEQVTFTDLENYTKLTRGAIMYYFKTKEMIFKTVCDKYLLNESSILKKMDDKIMSDTTLKELIKLYIGVISDMKIESANLGVKNMNRALVNITNQASYYYPNFEIKANNWQVIQIQLWKNVLISAVKNGEVKSDIDLDVASDLFEDIYCGISYAAIVYPDGMEIERLEKAFNFVYNLIKK